MFLLTLVLICCSFTAQQMYVYSSPISRQIINQAVELFIKTEEGFRSKPYYCEGGVLTVGYGTRAKNSNDIIDETIATQRLRDYLNNITYPKITTLGLKLTEGQLIAAASFDFNTNRLKEIVEGTSINCKKLLKYNKIKIYDENNNPKYIESQGLTKRRQKEYNICIK